MNITPRELGRIMPYASRVNLEKFHQPLNDTMAEFEINTSARAGAFLSQVAHESGSLRYVREIASGEAYEGRRDLGNTEAGDGPRYKGRGLIQVTGRANYQECAKALGVDLLATPELLEQPELAARSAGWFWNSRGLNSLADQGKFETITRKINGGLNGYQDRLAYFERAQKVLGERDETIT